jgi:hypothetical protein
VRTLSHTACAIALLLALGSCGSDAPSAPTTPTADGAVFLSFSPAPVAAAKLADAGRSTSAVIGEAGGLLQIEEDEALGTEGELEVRFVVKPGALENATPIHMGLQGQGIPGLVIGFQPGGLSFGQPAFLMVKADRELIDAGLLKADGSIDVYHHHDNGFVETAFVVFAGFVDDTYVVVVEVPGFSRYSLGE